MTYVISQVTIRGLLCRIRKAETPLDFERPVFNEFD